MKKTLETRTNKFILDANIKHNNLYTYDKIGYISLRKDIIVYCNTCKQYFTVNASRHIREGGGCPVCNPYIQPLSKMNIQLRSKEYIQRAQNKHNNKYDYSKSNYTAQCNDINVYCNNCKKYFTVNAYRHIGDEGCPRCYPYSPKLNKFNLQSRVKEFIYRANIKHNNKYEYSEINYTDNQNPIKIRCKKCNRSFYTSPITHLIGCGCDNCYKTSNSKSENIFYNILREHSIYFSPEKTYKDLYVRNKLRFDIFLDDYNILIEIDDLGHITNTKHTHPSDKLKKEFCIKNKIPLIRFDISSEYKYKIVIKEFNDLLLNLCKI